MKNYGYKCPECGQTYTSETRCDRLPWPCHTCPHPGPLHRDYSGLAIRRPMAEHMNATTGTVIRSEHQFKEELKRLSEEKSLYTGVESRLEMLEPEQARQGVTAEGLDSTNHSRVQRGLKPIDLDRL